jgi:hypothetical protein
MAAVFIASFTLAALLHRDTAVALLLCGVAMVTLVVSVIGANVRTPRRRRVGRGNVGSEDRQLRSGRGTREPGKR